MQRISRTTRYCYFDIQAFYIVQQHNEKRKGKGKSQRRKKKKKKKKFLSEVGFEPTPTYVDQKSPTRIASKVWPWVWRLRPLGHPDSLRERALNNAYIRSAHIAVYIHDARTYTYLCQLFPKLADKDLGGLCWRFLCPGLFTECVYSLFKLSRSSRNRFLVTKLRS